jgi:hypothetical protein
MKYATFLLSSIVVTLTTACSSLPASRKPVPPAPPIPPCEPVKESAPPPQVAVAPDPELERKLAQSRLQLLEKDAQISEMQVRLDDARLEVVRAMAKQQSLASRAEAASGMAEAEIALRSLPATAATRGAPEVSRLIKLSNAEFAKQNYAGALYLASQAKGAAVAARGQPAGANRGPLRSGETAFASPLKVQTAARANVRDGPGGSFKILFTLPAGKALTAYSHAGQWLRITDDSGRDGWIYEPLIGRRP